MFTGINGTVLKESLAISTDLFNPVTIRDNINLLPIIHYTAHWKHYPLTISACDTPDLTVYKSYLDMLYTTLLKECPVWLILNQQQSP